MSRCVRLLVSFSLAIIAAGTSLDSFAAGKPRAITHEDVWLMKRVGAPALSPDGKWVAFSVTEPAYDEDEQSSDLWVAPTDGSAHPRRITFTPLGESGAEWGPNGRHLAFSAKREGDELEQIYIMDVGSGGDAQRITQLSTGASSPRWRPDGRAILFTSDVYPGTRTDAENVKIAKQQAERKYNARVYDSAPIRHWDRWLDERRPTLFVQALRSGDDGLARGDPLNLLAGSALAASTGFGGRLEREGDIIDAAWTPDGRGVVFAATANRHEWAYADVVQSLWLVSARGGEPKRLTEDSARYEAPAFSRDGRALYAMREIAGDKVYNAKRLARWDWPMAGDARILTADFDRSVERFDIAPDGERLYFLAEDAGSEKLFEIPALGGVAREIGDLASGCYTNLAVGGANGRTVLLSRWESATNPAAVGRVDLSSGRWTALTQLNTERVARIDWQPLRDFWFTSSTGKRIHNLIALPPNFDPSRKYPLFVLIHGGPHTMWRDQFFVRWNYHLLAAPGYVVLLTNYSGSTGFGEAHAQSIQGDPLQGPARELNEAADAAIREFPFIDASRQAAGGASYGGHLTNWLAVTTDRYRALVSHAGLFDLKTQWSTSDLVYSRERSMGGPVWAGGKGWREQSPLYRAEQLKTPMLITIGELDYRVPINNTFELWTALQRQKVPSRLVVFPEENHWIAKGRNSRFFYEEVHRWLGRYLAGEEGAPGVVSSR